MGSSSSKGKSYAAAAQYGQIYARTDKPAYFGGETITGHIYLNILQMYPGRRLLLKLKGKEIVHIVKSETDTDGNYEDNHYKESKDIINILVPIYTWEAVIPGQYTIPFAFILPENLPSTFHQEGHRYMANVSYRLEAILEPDNPKNWNIKLKHKENFIVRRPLTKAAEQKEKQIQTEIYTCGCCENGSTYLTVQFAKNYYSPGETAEVLARLDNTQSKVDNIGLSFTLRQKITLRARGRKFDKEFIKVESRRNGAQIGEVTNTKSLALKLPPFQEGDYRSAKRDHIKLYLLGLGEDNSVMHSATNSKLIFSEYVLKVTCPMDGCCSTTPTAICPIEIYHPEIQAPIVAAPSDWHPKELENVNVSFAPPVDYSQQQLMNNNNIGLGMGSNNMNMQRTDEEIASQYHPPPQFSVDQYAKPQYGENYYG